MTKKQFIYTASVLLLTIVILFGLKKSYNFPGTKKASTDFHIENPDEVEHIFLTKKDGSKQIDLKKKKNGSWELNGKHVASSKMVEILLYNTMPRIRVKGFAEKNGRANVIARMASKGVTVEIYTDKKEPIRRYVVGGTTADLMGTYFWQENGEPMIIHIPGEDGYVSSRYSLNKDDWLSHTLYQVEKEQIEYIKLNYTQDDKLGFKIVQKDTSIIISAVEGSSTNINAAALKSYLNNFKLLNFEGFAELKGTHIYDSLAKTTPFAILDVKAKGEENHIIKIYHKKSANKMHGLYDKDGNRLAIDPNRYYAISSKTTRLVLIQDYTFKKVFIHYSDFLLPN